MKEHELFRSSFSRTCDSISHRLEAGVNHHQNNSSTDNHFDPSHPIGLVSHTIGSSKHISNKDMARDSTCDSTVLKVIKCLLY